MTILDQSRNIESEQGSFFLPEQDRPDQLWHHFSSRYFEQNKEFFLGSEYRSGVVMQFSYGAEGGVVLHDNHTATTKPKTLQFCAADDDSFFWQLTETHSDGRDQFIVMVTKKTLSGELSTYDHQGRQASSQELDENTILAVLNVVKDVIESDEYNNKTEKMRRRKDEALKNVIDFRTEGKKKYAAEKFQKLLDEKIKAMNKVGFISLGLEPIETTE